jgi:hypothetical protein
MRHEALSRDLRIRVTVADRDLGDALLVLYCYSCSDYVLAHGGDDSCLPAAWPQDDVVLSRVCISASCKAVAGPALLEELATAFGQTDAFHAVVQFD